MSAEVLPHTVEPHPITGMYNGKFGLWLFLASEVMLFGGLFSAYVLLRVNAPQMTEAEAAAAHMPASATTWLTGEKAGLSPWIGMFNTLVLITSSVTMVLAWAQLKMRNFSKGRNYLVATAALALVFLVVKLTLEYGPKLEHYAVWIEGQDAPVTGHIESGLDKDATEIVLHPDEHAEHEGGDHEDHGDHSHAMHIDKSKIVRLTNYGPAYNNFFGIYYTITGLHGLHILGGVLVIGYLILTGSRMYQSEPERFTNRIECTGLYWHFVDLVWIFLFPTFYLL